MENRVATNAELKLIEFLSIKASIELSVDWKDRLKVQNMNDGNMGGLLLFPFENTEIKRVFGNRVSEYQFEDVDGVTVIASLYVDQFGSLFELDVWKTDFSPLISLPNLPDLQS